MTLHKKKEVDLIITLGGDFGDYFVFGSIYRVMMCK